MAPEVSGLDAGSWSPEGPGPTSGDRGEDGAEDGAAGGRKRRRRTERNRLRDLGGAQDWGGGCSEVREGVWRRRD